MAKEQRPKTRETRPQGYPIVGQPRPKEHPNSSQIRPQAYPIAGQVRSKEHPNSSQNRPQAYLKPGQPRPQGRPKAGQANVPGNSRIDTTRRQGQAKRNQTGQKKVWPWQKFLTWLILICLILGVLSMAFSIFLKNKYRVDIVNLDIAAAKKRDAVLVLGCGVYADGSPTPMLRDRMNAGIAAYFKGAGKKLLLSGDHGQKHYDEVNAMKQLALDAGVPEEDIFLDHAGFSTYESLKRAQEIFGLKSVCLISQKYHLYRACYLADSLGLDYCGYPADAYAYKGQALREIREVLARVKAIFSANLQPQPEIMGPAIDITGDGRATWD